MPLPMLPHRFHHAQPAQPHPQRERQVHAPKHVVPLARLRVGHVQVERQPKPHDQEQHQHAPKPPPVLPPVPQQPPQPQQVRHQRNGHLFRQVDGGLAELYGPLQQRKGKLLKKVFHLLIPKLIGAARPRRQHGRQHALSAVLLAVEKLDKRRPSLGIVFVDGRI